VFVESPKPDIILRSETSGMHSCAGKSSVPSKRTSGIEKLEAEKASKEKDLNMDADLDPRRWNFLLREFVDWMEASSPQTKLLLACTPPVYDDNDDDADDEADDDNGHLLLRSSDKRRLTLEDSLCDIEGPLCAEERLIG
jgi:hypothetical protein